MSEFETDDEWDEDWFENEVDKYQDMAEKDVSTRQNYQILCHFVTMNYLKIRC